MKIVSFSNGTQMINETLTVNQLKVGLVHFVDFNCHNRQFGAFPFVDGKNCALSTPIHVTNSIWLYDCIRVFPLFSIK